MRAVDMDEVIFNGSGGRPTREHAEVTLTLANALGRRRRPTTKTTCWKCSAVSGGGLGSTYRINGREVRAKDVQFCLPMQPPAPIRRRWFGKARSAS